MKKRNLILGGILLAFVVVVFWLSGSDSKEEARITSVVQKGEFKITVTTTGELEAENAEKINGPQGLQQVGIWRLTIEDIIPDGTLVDSGQYVARMDMTEISNKIKDKETELEKLEVQVTKSRIDTSIEMRAARDELLNLKYSVEEARIVLEQSKFEPPATIRQSEITLDKSQRALEQAKKNYNLKLQKNKASMQDVSASYEQARRQLESLVEVRNQFTVKAPKKGMLIYRRNWDGKKMGVGAQISGWDNVVATLPDLSKMITKTYVNEIDISKVKVNQEVEIGIDAFPDKKLTGKVREVANIGEQLSGANAKVFEVVITVNEFDSILRPAMTTKNTIITNVFADVLFIPIEAVHTTDTITWVISGKKRKQVIVGESNDNQIVVKQGLEEGEEVLLTTPANAEELSFYNLKGELTDLKPKKEASVESVNSNNK
ncbi:MAG: efflux RND transporter periplasmic adaptor subunit [Bacteroidales bacterium]|nr:efflux RND transporter periplasmic adaptor subunit [Bacteroidales bacterium]MDD3665451.1 efflux RND transporter periplasmic adaptor subunit [Bacteroidales bacterium]